MLGDLVRRADAGERIIDATDFSQTPEINEADPSREKIEVLAEIICGGGEKSAAALFVLMGRVQTPQIAVIESELLDCAVMP